MLVAGRFLNNCGLLRSLKNVKFTAGVAIKLTRWRLVNLYVWQLRVKLNLGDDFYALLLIIRVLLTLGGSASPVERRRWRIAGAVLAGAILVASKFFVRWSHKILRQWLSLRFLVWDDVGCALCVASTVHRSVRIKHGGVRDHHFGWGFVRMAFNDRAGVDFLNEVFRFLWLVYVVLTILFTVRWNDRHTVKPMVKLSTICGKESLFFVSLSIWLVALIGAWVQLDYFRCAGVLDVRSPLNIPQCTFICRLIH